MYTVPNTGIKVFVHFSLSPNFYYDCNYDCKQSYVNESVSVQKGTADHTAVSGFVPSPVCLYNTLLDREYLGQWVKGTGLYRYHHSLSWTSRGSGS